MKSSFFAFLLFSLAMSCGSEQKLFERSMPSDGSKVIVKKGIFSGIDYIHIEKTFNNKEKTYMFYDCKCGVNKAINLRKGIISNGKRTLWTAVTDTSDVAQFYGRKVDAGRLVIPIEFLPITVDEINLLNESIDRVDKDCCKDSAQSVNGIIGFLRVKTNEPQ